VSVGGGCNYVSVVPQIFCLDLALPFVLITLTSWLLRVSLTFNYCTLMMALPPLPSVCVH